MSVDCDNALAEVEHLGRRHHHHTNWARSFPSQPELYFEPRDLTELRKILAAARVGGKTVKVVGFGHSLSDIACTDGYMVNLRHFNKVLEVNSEKHTVRVQCGILLKTLNEALYENKLALSSLGAISEVTVGGALAIGYHGSGKNFCNLSSNVLSLGMLLASGEVVELGPADGDRFDAACLHLGALGILLSATIQCEPAFRLHQVQYNAKLQDVLENLSVHLDASEHFRLMWYPHSDDVMCYHANRTTDKPICRPSKGVLSWFWGRLVGVHLMEFLIWLSLMFPGLAPFINGFAFYLDRGRTEVVDNSVDVFNFPCPLSFKATEWAVPIDKSAVALHDIKVWIETTKYPIIGQIEVRFMKEDNVMLSPAYNRDVCYINTVSIRPYYHDRKAQTQHIDAICGILRKAGGRPHWAKEYPLTSDDFRNLYPKWDTFLKVREAMDPSGIFLNRFLKRIFNL